MSTSLPDRSLAHEFPFLDAAHDEFRALVREQLAEHVLPHADVWEEQRRIGTDGWKALGAVGLLEVGHTGDDFLRSAVLLEELGATGYAGVRASVGVHAYMALSYVLMFGTAEQQAAHLPAAHRGERVTALAITEPDAGSDLRELRTYAAPRGGDATAGFVLDGHKSYVANGTGSGLLVVLARTSRPAGTAARGLTGASLLLVDADSPGITRRPQPMAGWRAADIAEIDFAGVEVPADALLGRRDRALLQLMRALDFERLVAGLLAVGGVRHTLHLVDRHVRTRRVKGVPLGSLQAVRHRLGELYGEFDLVRRYAHHAAWLHSRGRLDTRTSSVLKLRSTELALSAAQVCAQYHGALGYLEGSEVARVHRDATAGTIAAGASELLRDMIFEAN
ncbi:MULTISPECIES: acyl-CoA dehydrogenase family protein [unclassified Kitasatospora]|uniref:acyl-CoA dehydrogenase family protein n=1 Tax=unclassified Kitasatospora TaxID=2633591 RepID=UPI00070F3B23|nr:MULTISPECIES: acyl-CoA dehydrogenase family protein [unclassified Kitasatospora]KQV19259.1 acyl-CoA dehydrogenase [Kitasatospora sp. Root107]KRB77535.1 acyl-CoA dehydrogenase [Kitasatospora sp. Root187]